MSPNELANALLAPSGLYPAPIADGAPRRLVPPEPAPPVEVAKNAVASFETPGRDSDELMVRTLVEIINRSPKTLPTPEWARRLEIPFPEFVSICHEETGPTPKFRKGVVKLFGWFANGGKPW